MTVILVGNGKSWLATTSLWWGVIYLDLLFGRLICFTMPSYSGEVSLRDFFASSCLRWECWAFEEGGQTLWPAVLWAGLWLLKGWGNLEHVVYWKMWNTFILRSGLAKQFLLFHLSARDGLCIYTPEIAAYGWRWKMFQFSVLIHVCILPSNISGWIMTSPRSVEADFLPKIRWTEWLRWAKQME